MRAEGYRSPGGLAPPDRRRRSTPSKAVDGGRRNGGNPQAGGRGLSGGEVFVSNHTDNRIQVYVDDLTGSPRTIGTLGTANGPLQGPRNLGIANGQLYVADQFNDRISVFNAATGAFVRTIGRSGDTAGRFESPLGVAADATGDVFVADTFNGRIQRFTPAGRYVEEYLLTSSGVHLAADGHVFAVGATTNNVKGCQPGDGVLVDARIRQGNGATVGNDIYGTGQIAARTSPRGTSITWTLTFQNDSITSDRIKVRAPVLTSPRCAVRYTRGGRRARTSRAGRGRDVGRQADLTPLPSGGP